MESASQITLFAPRSLARTSFADIHAISRPARTFTGDFWTTHRRGDRLWFALGDVAGKGLPAALVMAMIQEELEHRIGSCAATVCDPATTLTRLHAFLRPLLPSNRFATVVIGHLRDDGTLTIANGGHCPPLLLRANGMIEEIRPTGPVAGILPSPVWTSTKTRMNSGDALVLYSDGVSEALASDGEELGVCGIRTALRGIARDATARGIASHVLSAIASTEDDVTLLAIKR
ncbi:MAG TPA: PP2C family protein-serine/threonine phosphatase [Thermoanaerobaculia bacterium]|nr:PP2C family protein-serine/threonine phosphatase [Thermoanaerobaculia bacterium]